MPESSASKSRAPVLLALIAALVVGLGLWWGFARDAGGGESEGQGEGDAATKVDAKDALRRKREARAKLEPVARVALGGRVLRASDEAPIAGAVVLVSRKGLIQDQAEAPGQPSRPLAAVTDVGGQWSLAGVDPGAYMVTATAEGYLPGARTDLRVTGRREPEPFDLRLEAGGVLLVGTVTDIGGGPIEEVLVRASASQSMSLGFDNPQVATITDEDGRYRLTVRPGRHSLSTHHVDYVAEARVSEVREGRRTEDFRLVPGATVEGVVLARTSGDPVAGARITFADSRNQGFGGGTTNVNSDRRVIETDAEGRFWLTGLRAGVVSLSATAKGYASLAPEDVALGIGEQVTGVELWVDTAHSISGFVVPKGDPDGAIEGVLVGAWQLQPFGLLAAEAPSASDGYFEIFGVPPGTWQVGAVGEDQLPNLSGATATIADADVSDVIVELDAGIYVRGRVDPGMSAEISLVPNPDDVSLAKLGQLLGDAVARATADADGAFEIGPLAPGGGFGGRTLTLAARTESGFRGEVELELGRDDLDGVVVNLEQGASVSGTVLDSTGMPQAGVTVSVNPAKPGPGTGGFGRGGGGFGRNEGGAPTAEDGSYAVRGLDPGTYLVTVDDSKGRAIAWADPALLDAEDRPEPIEIELDAVNEAFLNLRVAPRNGQISGLVLDAEGLPVQDAWVRASLDVDRSELFRRPGRPKTERVEGVVPDKPDTGGSDFTRSSFYAEAPVLTDENGLFLIKELRSDRSYNLIAEGERGGAQALAESVVPGSSVTLRLESLVGLVGRVTLDGEPVRDYSVELRGPSSVQKRVNDPEGEFTISRIETGDYEVHIDAELGTGDAEVTLPPGGGASITIELERGGTLKGQVVGERDGEPIAGLMVIAVADGRQGGLGGAAGILTGDGPKTDRDGRFELTNVPSGKGSLSFVDREASFSDSVSLAEINYEIESGDELDLGEVRALQADTVARDERGSLQLQTRSATYAARPRPPGTDLSAETPDPDADADTNLRLWVFSVDIGGVAEAAGIVPGDEIVAIDGATVASLGVPMAQMRLSPTRIRIGQVVQLELDRDGEGIELRLSAVDPRAAAPESPPPNNP